MFVSFVVLRASKGSFAQTLYIFGFHVTMLMILPSFLEVVGQIIITDCGLIMLAILHRERERERGREREREEERGREGEREGERVCQP